MKGKNGGLYTEPDKGEQIRQQQEGISLKKLADPAVNKFHAAGMAQQHEDAGKGEGGATHGIDDIFSHSGHRLSVSLMGDKRNRDEGEKLIEEVHGDGVGTEGNTCRYTVADGVKAEKSRLVFVMLHILKRIERGDRPQKTD